MLSSCLGELNKDDTEWIGQTEQEKRDPWDFNSIQRTIDNWGQLHAEELVSLSEEQLYFHWQMVRPENIGKSNILKTTDYIQEYKCMSIFVYNNNEWERSY